MMTDAANLSINDANVWTPARDAAWAVLPFDVQRRHVGWSVLKDRKISDVPLAVLLPSPTSQASRAVRA